MFLSRIRSAFSEAHQRLASRVRGFYFISPIEDQLQVAGVGGIAPLQLSNPLSPSSLIPSIWLAVPKSKVSHHKKRLKATMRDRITKRVDIVTDPRTGERTLRHKLPFNWKDHLIPPP